MSAHQGSDDSTTTALAIALRSLRPSGTWGALVLWGFRSQVMILVVSGPGTPASVTAKITRWVRWEALRWHMTALIALVVTAFAVTVTVPAVAVMLGLCAGVGWRLWFRAWSRATTKAQRGGLVRLLAADVPRPHNMMPIDRGIATVACVTVLERENADFFTSDEIVARAIASESFPVLDVLTVTQLTVLGMRADAHRLGSTVLEVGESKRLAWLVWSTAEAISDAVDAYHGADGHSVGGHRAGGGAS